MMHMMDSVLKVHDPTTDYYLTINRVCKSHVRYLAGSGCLYNQVHD